MDGFGRFAVHAGQRTQLIECGCPDCVQASKMAQQDLLAFRTDAGDGVENRMQGLFVPLAAVKLNRKAVGLVANAL